MKKQRVQFILMIGLLIITIGFLFIAKFLQKKETEEQLSQNTQEKIFDISYQDILSLSYDYEGEIISIIKDISQDCYMLEENSELMLNDSKIQSMLTSLSNITYTYKKNGDNDLLSSAEIIDKSTAASIRFTTELDDFVIYLGAENDVTNEYYILVQAGEDGEETLFLISQNLSSIFQVSEEDLIIEEESEEALEMEE